ncbi:MAG TPA: murein biosynthesis integral membrane protein MurJ [Acidimicrobiales bacterium]|nr:murein biosynthesis integral membrane protein MurJ [Acidimicrobiales bacterium]
MSPAGGPRRRSRGAARANPEVVAYPGVTRSTAVMAAGTTLSRVTGVIRIVALAYAVGALALADAYNLANTIPNILADIVIGGVLAATFVPVFVERLTTLADDEAWEAISAVVSVSLVVIAVASVLFLLASPLIIDAITAFNHSPQVHTERTVATELLVLFVPQLACYAFISIATALLNTRRRFAAPMFTPVANNVFLIVVLFLFGAIARTPTLAGVAAHKSWLLLLGVGTTLGVMLQAGLLIPSLRRADLHLRFRFDLRHEAVRTIGRLSGWTFGLVLANQVALLVVLAASEHVGSGALSAYTYAYTFFQLPYAVIAVSVMSATAPELATHWAHGDLAAFRRRMTIGLRTILAFVVPAAAGMLILARPLVALLLGHGAAGFHSATVPTATSLAMLALGVPGFCVFLYAIRVLQSVQDLRTAFWLYVLENGINIVLALALAGPLGVRGIALSISIAYTVAAVVALVHLRSRVAGLAGVTVARHLAHVLMATAVLVAAAVVGSNLSASESVGGLLLRVAVGTVAGAAAYVVAAGILARVTAPHRDGPTRPASPGADEAPDGTGRRRAGAPRRRARTGPPPAPPPPPPAGRPPMRPGALGPTRPPRSDESVHGRLDT